MMRVRTGSILVAMALAMLAAPAEATEHALVLEIDGAIGPPTADYVVRELAAAKPDEVGLVILRMNTPGGLDTSMREIIKAILASPVPVATYVAPNGARAASAGTYIAYASAIAAMAPSTNIGAATPVQLGGDSLLPGRSEQKQNRKAKTASRRTPWRARSSTTPSPIFAASPRSTAATPTGPRTPCARPQAFRPPRRSRFMSST
jgi:membrane-bound serine protease (ClpP class)